MTEAALKPQAIPGINATLAEAAAWLGCACDAPGVRFHGVCSDTRRAMPGALFIALKGPNHDGHEHLAEAANQGAVAALVEREVKDALPQLQVADSRLGLGRLAAAWRAELGLTLAAVTGSNGKTTVKEMLAAILAQLGPTLATRGNLNNDIGVPLTLLSLERGQRYGVIEMGANHPGEIDYLVGLTRPQVALVNNAAGAHLEGFGSLEGVARAKAEIYAGLAEGGVAVINADDAFAPLWRELAAGHEQLSFGMDKDADVRGQWQAAGFGGELRISSAAGSFSVKLNLAGRHNGMNALAASTCALALGADSQSIAAGLASVKPVAGRLQPLAGRNGAALINDCYNANPASLAAALKVLSAQGGRRVLVVGDMGELGADSAAQHRECGIAADEAGIDALYCIGELSRETAAGYGDAARHFDSVESLGAALEAELNAGTTLLFKASRSMRLERVIEQLKEQEKEGA